VELVGGPGCIAVDVFLADGARPEVWRGRRCVHCRASRASSRSTSSAQDLCGDGDRFHDRLAALPLHGRLRGRLLPASFFTEGAGPRDDHDPAPALRRRRARQRRPTRRIEPGDDPSNATTPTRSRKGPGDAGCAPRS